MIRTSCPACRHAWAISSSPSGSSRRYSSEYIRLPGWTKRTFMVSLPGLLDELDREPVGLVVSHHACDSATSLRDLAPFFRGLALQLCAWRDCESNFGQARMCRRYECQSQP